VELQTRSIKTVKIKTTEHRKNAMERERKHEGLILEIESDGKLVGTISNSACFTVPHVHDL
jgi:prophage tail gpP-like protein